MGTSKFLTGARLEILRRRAELEGPVTHDSPRIQGKNGDAVSLYPFDRSHTGLWDLGPDFELWCSNAWDRMQTHASIKSTRTSLGDKSLDIPAESGNRELQTLKDEGG